VVAPHGPTHAQKPAAASPPAHAATQKPGAHKPPGKPAAPAAPVAAPKPESKPAEAPAQANPAPAGPEKGTSSGLPLPRFASLRSDDVNLRAGPGTRYPIEWVYKRRDLPVEIEREFEVWRLIKDPDGVRGWVHQATLTGRRSFLVEGGDAMLRSAPQETAAPVAELKPGVIGRIRSCDAKADWCKVQVGQYRGFLKRGQVWGVLPGETISP
jgi:SH3-like domain-containing protein